MTVLCSLNANENSFLCYNELEKGLNHNIALLRVQYLTYDKYNGECTADHVFYRENEQQNISVDLTNHSNDNSSTNFSISCEKPDTCSNYYDSTQNDVARHNDAESNFRDMAGNRNDYQDNDYVPDYNAKPINLTKTKESPVLEKIQQLSSAKWPDAITIDEECYLWEQELECWKGDRLKEAQHRRENRIAAYQNCKDNPYNCKEYCYDLSTNAKAYLDKNQINAAIFEKGLYNEMQHQLHSELLDIAEELTGFDVNVRYPGTFKLVNADVARITATGVQCNKTGDIIKTAAIADFAWKVLECGKAVLKGGYQGVKSVGSYALENPHEVPLYGVAPELMSGYYTLKLIHSVGSLAIDLATVGFSKESAKSLENATFQGVLYGTSSIIFQICLNNLLNKFSVFFVGKSKESLVAVAAGECPVTYAAFKDVCKARARRSSENIKNLKIKLFKEGQNLKSQNNSKVKKSGNKKTIDTTSSNKKVKFLDTHNAKKGYKDLLIRKKENHIFTDDHKNRGILKLGKSEDAILDSLANKVGLAIESNLLCEGDNQISTIINNCRVFIRVHVRDADIISTTVLLEKVNRNLGNCFEL